mgnify:CR=1 FL=1
MKGPLGQDVNIRVGVHSGSVVSGVMGLFIKFADIIFNKKVVFLG